MSDGGSLRALRLYTGPTRFRRRRQARKGRAGIRRRRIIRTVILVTVQLGQRIQPNDEGKRANQENDELNHDTEVLNGRVVTVL